VTTAKEVRHQKVDERTATGTPAAHWGVPEDLRNMPTFHYKHAATGSPKAGGSRRTARRHFVRWKDSALRPVSLSENRVRHTSEAGVPALGNLSLKFQSERVSAKGAGKLHASAVEPARAGVSLKPGARHPVHRSLHAGCEDEVEGIHDLVIDAWRWRMQWRIAGSFPRGYVAMVQAGERWILSVLAQIRRFPIARKRTALESDQRDVVSDHPARARGSVC